MTLTTEKIKDMTQEVAGDWLDFKALSGSDRLALNIFITIIGKDYTF